MLRLFRKEGVQKKVLWVLAAIIIISFVFFGTSASQLDSSSSYAGKVFGKKISFQDFEKYYANSRDQALMIHGENFYKMSPYLNLENETWDRIILLNEARKQRIKVSDQELIDFIQSLPLFRRDDRFDPILYKDIVRYVFRRDPRDFEEGMRGHLMIKELFDRITSTMTITEKDIREAYRQNNEKIQISYALFPVSDFLNEVMVSEDEASQHFQLNQQNFMTAPSLNIEFINLNYPKNPSDEDKAALKDQVYQAAQKLNTGGTLEDLAKEHKVEIQQSGLFSLEQPNMPMGWSYETIQKIFDLKTGDVSEPIETPLGYQFLRVKERREASLPEFAVVKQKVIDEVKNIKALEKAGLKAEEYAQKITDAFGVNPQESFKSATAALGLKIEQTPLFNRGQYLPTIGLSKEFQDAAFDLTEKDKLSKAVKTARGYCILYRDGIEEVNEEEFQKAKDEYAKNLINEKRNQMIIEFMTDLRLRADVQNNIPHKNNAS